MTSRRAFIKAGTALSVMTMPFTFLFSSRSIDRIVFDERFEECVQFAKESEARGCTAFGTGRDITPLWFTRLAPLLEARPYPIAGLNDEATVFVLERLAWEKSFHLAYRAEHTLMNDGTALHVSRIPNLASRMPQHDDLTWPAALARLVISLRHDASAAIRCARCRPTFNPLETLVSWVLVPRHWKIR